MAKISPLVLLPPVAFGVLAVVFLFGLGRGNTSQIPSTLIGKEPPALAETALPGIPAVTAANLADGQVKIVNFWASWCPPCRQEHPTLTAMSAEGIPVYGVNLRDQEANALRFLRGHGNPFAAVSTDPAGRTAIDWGVTAPPETFIIDGSGKITYRFVGPIIGDGEKAFRTKLEKAAAK